MNREQAEDLKAFEQRLMECIRFVRSRTRKWRFILVGALLWFLLSLYIWWMDDNHYYVFALPRFVFACNEWLKLIELWTDTIQGNADGYWEMMSANKSLTASIVVLTLLYIFGVLERNNAASILTSRSQAVLYDYNLSCDQEGKLIIKRQPATVITNYPT